MKPETVELIRMIFQVILGALIAFLWMRGKPERKLYIRVVDVNGELLPNTIQVKIDHI